MVQILTPDSQSLRWASIFRQAQEKALPSMPCLFCPLGNCLLPEMLDWMELTGLVHHGCSDDLMALPTLL